MTTDSDQKIERKQCLHCATIIEACPAPCFEWECSYHAHLGEDCESEAGIAYRNKIERRRARRIGRDELEFKTEMEVLSRGMGGISMDEVLHEVTRKGLEQFEDLITKRL